MEPAKDLVERPLPSITLENCSLYPSTSYEIISPRFFHLWEGFAEEVLEICASLDLNTLVPLTHDEDNEFVVASKRGLIGRMEKHLCDPVIKTLSVTDLSDFRFGDYQALHGYNPENVPELLLLTLSDGIARLVLEMKTCWTLKLQHYPVSAGYAVLVGIKHHLGQLVSYMRSSKLKLGVLSTYEFTVFVKRTADYRFEMSLPIAHDDVQPSVRQCFVAMAVLSSNEPKFHESADFNEHFFASSPYVHHQPSTRPSSFRNSTDPPKEELSRENVGPGSILFGHDDAIARYFVNCHRRIPGTANTLRTKAVFEVTWDGRPAIAKCWGPSFYQMYANETRTYQLLAENNPRGHPCFARHLQHGKIYCSSIFPIGYILILTMVEGEPLALVWDSLSSMEKTRIRAEVKKAIVALRDIGLVSVDCGKHNVIHDRTSGVTTLVDFEMVQAVEPETISPDAPEMRAIFGLLSALPSSHYIGAGSRNGVD